jgi:predicted O-methyltransferase YrrM
MVNIFKMMADAVSAAAQVAAREGLGVAASRVTRQFGDMSQARSFLRQYQNANSVDEVVALVFSTRVVRPLQIPSEITGLANAIKRLQPRRMLEIGTAEGGTLAIFARCATPDATIISVDLPVDAVGGGYRAWREPVYRGFAGPNQTIHLLRRDSHKRETVESVESILRGEKLDFLFIDGDHSYNGAKTDFELYGRLVRSGGLIGMHDIVEAVPDRDFGSHRLWAEVRKSFGAEEFIADPFQTQMGIGLLSV